MELIELESALSTLLPEGATYHARKIPETTWRERSRVETDVGHRCAAEAASRAGEPVVGSTSHARKFAIAVAVPTSSYASIGIDIEPTMTLERAERVAHTIATESERRSYGCSPWRLTLVFSAKESVFKCVHPIAKEWFDFDETNVVEWDEPERRIAIALLRDIGPFARGTTLTARYAHVAGHVLTAVAWRAS